MGLLLAGSGHPRGQHLEQHGAVGQYAEHRLLACRLRRDDGGRRAPSPAARVELQQEASADAQAAAKSPSQQPAEPVQGGPPDSDDCQSFETTGPGVGEIGTQSDCATQFAAAYGETAEGFLRNERTFLAIASALAISLFLFALSRTLLLVPMQVMFLCVAAAIAIGSAGIGLYELGWRTADQPDAAAIEAYENSDFARAVALAPGYAAAWEGAGSRGLRLHQVASGRLGGRAAEPLRHQRGLSRRRRDELRAFCVGKQAARVGVARPQRHHRPVATGVRRRVRPRDRPPERGRQAPGGSHRLHAVHSREWRRQPAGVGLPGHVVLEHPVRPELDQPARPQHRTAVHRPGRGGRGLPRRARGDEAADVEPRHDRRGDHGPHPSGGDVLLLRPPSVVVVDYQYGAAFAKPAGLEPPKGVALDTPVEVSFHYSGLEQGDVVTLMWYDSTNSASDVAETFAAVGTPGAPAPGTGTYTTPGWIFARRAAPTGSPSSSTRRSRRSTPSTSPPCPRSVSRSDTGGPPGSGQRSLHPGKPVRAPPATRSPMKLRCASTVPAPKHSPRMSRQARSGQPDRGTSGGAPPGVNTSMPEDVAPTRWCRRRRPARRPRWRCRTS